MGLLTTSIRPLIPLGVPSRLGTSKIDSAISVIPCKRDVPPVRSRPDVMKLSIPARKISLFINVKISSIRGSNISPSICLGSFLGLRPPIPGTSIVSSLLISRAIQVPYFIFIFSASAWDARKPMLISFVRLLPPSDRTNVCLMFFPKKIARSLVPPPRSRSAVPRSFSSSVSTASPEARGSRTISQTSRPVRFAHFTML